MTNEKKIKVLKGIRSLIGTKGVDGFCYAYCRVMNISFFCTTDEEIEAGLKEIGLEKPEKSYSSGSVVYWYPVNKGGNEIRIQKIDEAIKRLQ